MTSGTDVAFLVLAVIGVTIGGWLWAPMRARRLASQRLSSEQAHVASQSRAELLAMLQRLREDELWARGNAAVAAYVLAVMDHNANAEDGWDSDEPITDALQAEIERRFTCPRQREDVAAEIRTACQRHLESNGNAGPSLAETSDRGDARARRL